MLDVNNNLINKVTVSIVSVKYDLHIQLIDESKGMPRPFYAKVLPFNRLLESIIKEGRFDLLVEWAKDEFKLVHRRVTFAFCPNLYELFSSKHKKGEQ